MSSKRIIERHPDGRIKKARLTSEEASELGKKSAEVRWSTTKTAEILLAEAGYDDDNPPPEYARIMANQAVKSHSAMRDWRQFIGAGGGSTADTYETLGYYIPPKPGERCPRCGYWNLAGKYEIDEFRNLLDLLKYARENEISMDAFKKAFDTVVEKHRENPRLFEHKNIDSHA